ncbi:hypothetical protein EJ357_24515 [Streptomyces cyaneochromogenes]|uniref:Integrase catalytic domain-containing protein n=1 Tax=Streptomyces cyaneochromogenes TaxID=2496836 RepID=A0A3S9MAP5_9ACTN|nr:integrase core domain-containing protein [Streptomyces cyaneochromogenes]AZQ36240.1 hypothetical protein EJ357_24515 [Streptomyces cyaneochromogenes]
MWPALGKKVIWVADFTHVAAWAGVVHVASSWTPSPAASSAGPRRCRHHSDAGSRSILFKAEVIKPQRPWKTLSHVELATAEWVDWYNHRRLHSEIGHVPPVEYEANFHRATTNSQITANI